MSENIITAYISSSPVIAQDHLWQIYDILEAVIGDKTIKTLSYQMPTYKAKRNVIHFSANKSHIGIYPGPATIAFFEPQLANYAHSKGALQIRYDQPVPSDLISQLAKFSYELNNA